MKFDFDIFLGVTAFVLFFAMLFGVMMYIDTQKYECKKAAIEKNMPAVEIITVCR
jgi:hypothetical protein